MRSGAGAGSAAGSPSLSSAGRKALGGLSGVGSRSPAPRPTAVDVETNPFILPSDEDVFKLREKETAQREQARFCARAHSGVLILRSDFFIAVDAHRPNVESCSFS